VVPFTSPRRTPLGEDRSRPGSPATQRLVLVSRRPSQSPRRRISAWPSPFAVVLVASPWRWWWPTGAAMAALATHLTALWQAPLIASPSTIILSCYASSATAAWMAASSTCTCKPRLNLPLVL
jgi:hypothetical protein